MPKQLEALDYWRHGYGYKRIAIMLGIPPRCGQRGVLIGRSRQ